MVYLTRLTSPAFLSRSFTRAFSSTIMASTKHEFLCILPDKPDALAKRLEVRS